MVPAAPTRSLLLPRAAHPVTGRPLTRRTVLKGLVGGAGLAVAGTALAACGSDSPAAGGSADSATATLQLSWTHSVQFGGSYLAADRGYWSDQGLGVTLVPGGPNVAGDANTVSGAALMNISGGDGVARSNAEGAGLVMIGQQYQKAPATLLSLGANAITTPAELAGKRIGVSGTDTPALDAFLTINGMSRDDVVFVPTQYDPAPLVADQVDTLFCFYNDLPVALRSQGIDGYSMLLSDFGYNPMSQVYTVLKSNLEDDDARARIVKLLRGDIQGWQTYQEDPDAAAELTVADYPDAGLDLETQKLQAEVQMDIMFSDLTESEGFAWFTDEQVQDNIELYAMLDLEADESMWDRSILEEIYADGPTA